ncbi:MAG: cyclic nucleotide-binding domain-containing protein [Myxococcales bacterium]|nr:cyclic nucleotide-binding domain-containing protein [Myxococcales bacterium]
MSAPVDPVQVPLPPWFEPGGLLDEATEAARQRLEQAMTCARFEPGELIYALGDEGECLLYVVEGEARVFRPDGPDGVELDLATVGPGQTLGETTFVVRGARTASVQALTAVTAWRLPFDVLAAVIAADPSTGVIYRHIAESLATANRAGNADIVSAAVEVSLAAKLLITVIAIQSGTLLAAGLMTQLMKQVASTTIMLVGYLAFITAIGVVYASQIKLPRAAFGVTLDGWRPSLRLAVRVTLPAMAAVTALKWVLVTAIPAYAHVPVFDVLDVTRDHGRTLSQQLMVVGVSALVYALVGGFQELYARGMLQGQMYRFFSPRTTNPWPAILVSNLLFASIHVSWSMPLAIASFFGGLLWGWIYAQRPTLVGATVSHVLLGLWIGRALNLFALFRFGPLAMGG